jgi:altronate dehydratase
VGTRNCIAIIGSVNCAATVVRKIARRFEDAAIPGIDAVVPLTHGSGCGMAKNGEGMEVLERTIVGYMRNPNFAGAVVIGLGCEVAQIADMFAHHGLEAGPRSRPSPFRMRAAPPRPLRRASRWSRS